jgi:hypothetical protein
MKKLLLSFTGFAFALGFALWSGCKDDCPPCGDNYKKIPETTKEWINFGIGSTWIYRLAEDTTVFDTLTLMGVDERASNIFCRSEFAPAVGCSEVLIFIFKHSNAKYFPRYNVDTINGDFENWHVYTPHGGGEFFQINRFGNEGVFLAFPLIKGEYYGRYTLVDTLPQFTVLNKNYTNVVLSAEVDNTGVPIAAKVWYAKHIGLLKIKSVLPNNRTWELINHNIKK